MGRSKLITTAIDWYSSYSPEDLLEFISKRVGSRILRLITTSYATHLVKPFPPRLKWAIEIANKYADGEVGQQELSGASARLRGLLSGSDKNAIRQELLEKIADFAALASVSSDKVLAYMPNTTGWLMIKDCDPIALCHIIRDIVGDPFNNLENYIHYNPQIIDAAKQFYHSFDQLSISNLHRLLKHSDNEINSLVRHFEHELTHYRGCWAIDLILKLR